MQKSSTSTLSHVYNVQYVWRAGPYEITTFHNISLCDSRKIFWHIYFPYTRFRLAIFSDCLCIWGVMLVETGGLIDLFSARIQRLFIWIYVPLAARPLESLEGGISRRGQRFSPPPPPPERPGCHITLRKSTLTGTAYTQCVHYQAQCTLLYTLSRWHIQYVGDTVFRVFQWLIWNQLPGSKLNKNTRIYIWDIPLMLLSVCL